MPRGAYDDYEAFRRAGSAGDYARRAWPRSTAVGREDDRASRLRRVLAGSGARQTGGAASVASAHHVDSGPVGPGGHVGRDPLLPGAEGARAGRSQLPGDGSVAAQPGELRRLQSRAAEMGRRHRAAVPPRRAEAVLRSVPENGRAESRHAAGVHLQHRRESLGSLEELAAGLRSRAAPLR